MLANPLAWDDTPRVAKCALHDISAGPDGLCALCRASVRAEAAKGASKIVWSLLGGALFLGGALLAYRPLFARHAPETATAEPATNAAVGATEAEPNLVAAPREAAVVVAKRAPKDLTLGGTLRVPPLAASADATNVEPTTNEAGQVAAPGDALALAPPAAPTGTQKPPPTKAEIEAAVRSVPIVLFSTSWCSVCKHARAFLTSNGFAFQERDIDRDAAARAEVKRRTGATTIPVLEIDGVMGAPGFSEAGTAQAIAASVERRLGVTGIQVRPASR